MNRTGLLTAVSLAAAAALSGCAVNPITGRNQLIALPAAQLAHAELDFTLSSAAQGFAPSSVCARRAPGVQRDAACAGGHALARFTHQVERMQTELTAQARIIAPELFGRIAGFDVRIEDDRSEGSASSAGGRIVLDSGLAALNPTDDVVAFVIAREMGHVIARHGEENAGAKMFFSALTAIVPGAVVVRFAASMLGAGVLRASWAEGQRQEADILALQLLAATGRSSRMVALNLQSGLTRLNLPGGEWSVYFGQSIDRVAAIALMPPATRDETLAVASLVDVPGEIR